MTFLNKIILTFTTENIEAYQWTDRIETKHGKIFDTMKDLIKFYTNEEKKRRKKEEKRRKNILRKEKAKKHWSMWRENVRDMVKKLTEEKKNNILRKEKEEIRKKKKQQQQQQQQQEKDIKTIRSYFPDLDIKIILEMFLKENGDIVNTMMELGY